MYIKLLTLNGETNIQKTDSRIPGSKKRLKFLFGMRSTMLLSWERIEMVISSNIKFTSFVGNTITILNI